MAQSHKIEGKTQVYEGERSTLQFQLRWEDFVTYGFTEGCPGCQAMLSGTPRQGHDELCRRRMEEAIRTSPEGQVHACRQQERENGDIADSIARNIDW